MFKTEHLNPVSATDFSVLPMASADATVFIFLGLFLSIFSPATVESKAPPSIISLGSQLSPTRAPSSWLSPSGYYAFGFYKQGDGFAVGIWLNRVAEKTVVWTANRDHHPFSADSTLLLTKEGWLVVREEGSGLDTQITNSSSWASYASMLDSGNFVLYNALFDILWQSFNQPTDTILPTMTLTPGNQLFSSKTGTDHSTGRFRLKNQLDGNLVLYPVQTTDTAEDAYWASGIFAQGYQPILGLEGNGHLYLFNDSGKIVMNFTNGSLSGNRTVFYRATIDSDGVFRLYSHSLERNGGSSTEIKWSALDDECQVKGVCGFNSYCNSSLKDNWSNCSCLPGYGFIDPHQRFLGCERAFAEQSCRGRTDNITYKMQTMVNLVLEDNPYWISQEDRIEDCENACLGDCSCHASLLKNGRCSKLMLPLRYGRRGSDNSTTVSIKVGNGNITTLPTEAEGMGIRKTVRKDILIFSIILAAISIGVIAVSCVLIFRYQPCNNKTKLGKSSSLTEGIVLSNYQQQL